MPTNADLREFIIQFFSGEELDTLCFDSFPEVMGEFNSRMSLNEKAITLISYCQRRGLLNKLYAVLARERPSIWKQHFVTAKTTDERQNQPGAVQAPPNRMINAKTGIEMIRIPAGTFLYGDNRQKVDLPEYWIGRAPVTNSQYKRFLDANPQHNVPFVARGREYNWDKRTRAFQAGMDAHPVVFITWEDTVAFCKWAGLQLPTDQMWEKAARGTDERLWPWGNEKPTPAHCNFNKNVGGTTPVGKYSPQGDSPYGCVDMAGNICEWTWQTETKTWVLRGGAWDLGSQLTRVTYRFTPHILIKLNYVGFRVVANSSKMVR